MSTQNEAVIVVLDTPSSKKGLLGFSRDVLKHLTGNARFPDPTPKLPIFEQNIDRLEDAERAASTRARGARQARDAAARTVRSDLTALRGYVQLVIRGAPADADQAEWAQSAFMRLKRDRRYQKGPLQVAAGSVSGSVRLEARRDRWAVAYFWEYSLDQVTWLSGGETAQVTTEIPGLTPGKLHYFRFRALRRKGKTDPSQIVTLMVV